MLLTAEGLQSRVLYKSEHVLILDKPAGLAVHKGPKGGLTLDDFLPDLAFGAPQVPQLAHRLDRDTTGCLVLGRDKPALRALGAAFAGGKVSKTYCALVMGNPSEDSGIIDLPLARRSHDKRSWWMKVDPSGDPSRSSYKVLSRSDGVAFVALSPYTGRTHQLRVHCAAMGWPIAGDRIYGGDRAAALCRSIQLHAWRIRLPGGGGQNAWSGPLEVTAPLPSAMSLLLAGLLLDASALDSLPEPIFKETP